MDQPSALLQLGEGVCDKTAVNELLDLLDFCNSRLPLGGENFAGEFSPSCFALFVIVGGLVER